MLEHRAGLNGSQCLSSTQCLFDEVKKNFYVWIVDSSIDKFTRSTLLNIVDFAEKKGAKNLIFI